MPNHHSFDRRLRRVLVCFGLCMLFGCVIQERRDLIAARDAYDRCVRELSAEQPECIELDEKRRVLQQQYESHAQRAWGCNPTTNTCPPSR